MNKETEMYLINKIEELVRNNTFLETRNAKLETQLYDLLPKQATDGERKKAQAFDVVRRFISITKNETPNCAVYNLVFTIPSIEINEAMKELFEEAING